MAWGDEGAIQAVTVSVIGFRTNTRKRGIVVDGAYVVEESERTKTTTKEREVGHSESSAASKYATLAETSGVSDISSGVIDPSGQWAIDWTEITFGEWSTWPSEVEE